MCETALGRWFAALLDSVRKDGWDDDEIAHHFAGWNEKFTAFLADEDVAMQLLRPFTGDEPDPELDAETMRRCWQAADLPFADELNVAGINRRYVKELNGKRLRKAEWRALLQGQLDVAKLEVAARHPRHLARLRSRQICGALPRALPAARPVGDEPGGGGTARHPAAAGQRVRAARCARRRCRCASCRANTATVSEGGRKEAATALAAAWDASEPRPARQMLGDEKSRGWCCWAIPAPARR